MKRRQKKEISNQSGRKLPNLKAIWFLILFISLKFRRHRSRHRYYCSHLKSWLSLFSIKFGTKTSNLKKKTARTRNRDFNCKWLSSIPRFTDFFQFLKFANWKKHPCQFHWHRGYLDFSTVVRLGINELPLINLNNTQSVKLAWMLFPISDFCKSCKLELSVNLGVHHGFASVLFL